MSFVAVGVGDLRDFNGSPETLIETNYLGDEKVIIATKGEAFYDAANATWKYRPKGGKIWYKVSGEDLDCANDGGWLNGTYIGKKAINTEGKGSWSEKENSWIYKLKGDRRSFLISEEHFIIERDKDVF